MDSNSSKSLNFTGVKTTNQNHLEEEHLLIISIYVFLVGVLGFFGNLWVIIAFCRYKNLRTSTNIFIVHLAGCDLFLALLDLVFSFPSSVKHRWLFGTVACEIFGFSYHFSNAMSLNTLAVISLDRFWVITKPSFGVKITVKRAILGVLLTYFYTLLFTLPILFGWMGFHEETYYTGCYLNFEQNGLKSLIYSIMVAIFLFLAPFIVMVWCYYSIFASVRQRGNSSGRLSRKKPPRGGSRWNFALPHWRTARMIVVVISVYLLCWSPYVVVSLCVAFFKPNISALVQEVTLLLGKSGIIYNPFIYAALNHRFRNAFLGMLCRRQNAAGKHRGGDCSSRRLVASGARSSFRASRASTTVKTFTERFGSEKDIEMVLPAQRRCKLRKIHLFRTKLSFENLEGLKRDQNDRFSLRKSREENHTHGVFAQISVCVHEGAATG